MRRFYFLALLLGFYSSTSAQYYQFSDTVSQFGIEVQTILASTKNETAINIGNSFGDLWEQNTFNADQQQRIIQITKGMLAKKMPLRPYVQTFFSMLINSIEVQQLPNAQVTNLLFASEKVLEQYPKKDFFRFINRTDKLFLHQALYYGRHNSTYFTGGTITIDYIEPTNLAYVEETYEEEEEEEEIIEEDSWGDDSGDSWGSEEPADDLGSDSDDDWGSDWSGSTVEEVVEPEVKLSPEEQEEAFIKALSEVAQEPIEGPVIKISGTDLFLSTDYDSTKIENTSGSFLIVKNMWVGEGGKFTWEMTGLPPEDVYAQLSYYNFEVNMPKLSGENVSLTYKGKLEKPVQGIFDFESRRHATAEYNKFPRFKSYSSLIEVNGVGGDELTYKGGFALDGPTINSSSVLEGKASIEAVKNSKRYVAKSSKFVLSDSIISARHASFVLHHGHDSIYHPSVQFKYESDSNRVVLVKEDGGFKNTPYRSTYFNTDIKAELLTWNMNQDSLDFSILNARNQTAAIVESIDYFNKKRYKSLVGYYSFHPLLVVVGYARKTRSSEFYVIDLIDYLKKNPSTVKNAMISLMQNEFIDYEPESGFIKVRRKAYHYVLSEQGRKDFDNLLITSISPHKPNVTLNFDKNELTIRGIEQFYISRELNVFIQPDSSEIIMLKDRNFMFDGLLTAGNFEYRGEGITFNYDSFLVDMPKINSISFNIGKDEASKRKAESAKEQIGNQLSETAGILYINKPNNKSAKKFYPQYPMFNADKGAIVYFDNNDVLGGAYDKSLYFTIPPFNVDSVSSSDPKSISFRGIFTSGVLPPFEETLYMLEDNSLGFEHKTPPDGYTLYDGMGTLHGDIKLNNQGLRSKGKIEYLNTVVESEDFIFYVDSVSSVGSLATLSSGNISGTSFPEARVENYRMQWLPYEDKMTLWNTDSAAIEFYNQSAHLDGSATITPSGVQGSGNLLTRGSETSSEDFLFRENSLGARHSQFEIKSDNPEKSALAGDDVRVDFNLTDNIANISPEEEGVAAISFPYAQLNTSITTASWDLEAKKVRMIKAPNVLIENSYFYTTRKELDSLVFNATEAVYDMEALTLNISGIPYINVADARITPENNEVTFLENAELDELHNATLVMDTLNQYHTLFDGNIKIVSRTHFEGDATYQFISSLEDTFAIKFGEFSLEEQGNKKQGFTKHTIASGEVVDLDNFLISPGFLFKGSVKMTANKEVLELDGYVKLDLKVDFENTEWIKHESDAQIKEILINYEDAITADGQRINAGLHFESGTNDLYHTFISDLITPADVNFFTPKGILSFNAESNSYEIAVISKSAGASFNGEVFKYNESSGEINFEGPINFITREPNIKVTAAAKGKGNLETDEFLMNAFLVLDFGANPGGNEIMAEDLFATAELLNKPSASRDLTAMLYKASEIIGDKAAKAYEERTLENYTPLVTMSGALAKDMVISDVDMKWSSSEAAWYSVGKIGVSNIGRTDINARLDGFLEIKKEITGDVINLFIQTSASSWYFWTYRDNRLLMFSSNAEFNNQVLDKSNISKAKIGTLIFTVSDLEETTGFINDFRSIYLGIDEPYTLEIPMDLPDETTEDDPEGTEDQEEFLLDDSEETEEEEEEEEDDEGF